MEKHSNIYNSPDHTDKYALPEEIKELQSQKYDPLVKYQPALASKGKERRGRKNRSKDMSFDSNNKLTDQHSYSSGPNTGKVASTKRAPSS